MQYPVSLKMVVPLSFLALLVWPGEAKEADEPFMVSKAGTSIRIDGKLDAAWKQTEVRTLDHYRRYEKADDRQKTKFRNRWAFQAIRQDRNDATGNRRSWGTLFEVDPEHPSVHEPGDFGFLEFVE